MAGAKVLSDTPGMGCHKDQDKKNKRKVMKLNTHIYKTVVAAICVVALSPALVVAASTPKHSLERGIIKSVDMDAHTLVVSQHKKNAEQKFQWDDQTTFTERHASANASALKAGEHVRLTYAPGGDTPILKKVQIAPTGTEKHSASNLSTARSAGA
jgi:hypothetical protein